MNFGRKFDVAFAKLIELEGSKYVDDPYDHGGATKFGLSKKFLDAHFKKDVSKETIESFTIEQAKEIYYDAFWKANNLESINNPKIVTLIFICEVHLGSFVANVLLQHAINDLAEYFDLKKVEVDGIIGKNTLDCLNDFCVKNDRQLLIDKIYIYHIVNRYRKLASNFGQSEYLLGWINRLYKIDSRT